MTACDIASYLANLEEILNQINLVDNAEHA